MILSFKWVPILLLHLRGQSSIASLNFHFATHECLQKTEKHDQAHSPLKSVRDWYIYTTHGMNQVLYIKTKRVDASAEIGCCILVPTGEDLLCFLLHTLRLPREEGKTHSSTCISLCICENLNKQTKEISLSLGPTKIHRKHHGGKLDCDNLLQLK